MQFDARLWLSIILPTMMSWAAAQAGGPGAKDESGAVLSLRGTDHDGSARLVVDGSKLAGIRAAHGKIHLAVPIDATQRLDLELEQFEVIAPDAKFIRMEQGQPVQVSPPQMVFLRGSIIGDPGSHAYLAINQSAAAIGGGGGAGSITRADGTSYKITTDYGLDGRSIGLIVRPMAAGGAGDAADAPTPCGTPDHESPIIVSNHNGTGPPAGGSKSAGGTANLEPAGPRALVLAVEADQKFVRLFSTTAQAEAYIAELAGAVSDLYIRELNFRVVLVHARTWSFGGEPFSAADLAGFRTWWNTTNPPPGIQFVHMLSGRRDLSYGGIAYLADACSGFAFGISGFILGDFPTPVSAPNLGNWDLVVMSHEMGHNLGSPHTWNYLPEIDGCNSGIEERGTVMSYCHTRAGGLLNIDVRMHATVATLIADEHAAAACLWHDCNANGVNDADELDQSLVADTNANGIPDTCEDCNANGILDPTEISSLGGADINGNGVLDSCEDDCNGNSVPDQWEINQGAQFDANGNGRPDSCEPDCDGNGVADFIDIRFGAHTDFDRNSMPDICQDCNFNGIVDWIDLDRQFNWFIGQADGGSAGAAVVREYHEASGVSVRDLGPAGGVISQAYDLCFGPDRQLYVASFGNSRIVRIDVDAGTWSEFIASGVGGLQSPAALAFGPDGHLYVSNQSTNSVLRYNGLTGAPMGTFVPAGSGGMTIPWGLAFDATGRLWVACGDNRLRRYFPSGNPDPILVINPPAALNDPRDLVILPPSGGGGGGDILVTNRMGHSISRFNSSGGYVGRFNDDYPLTSPWGIVIGTNGNVYAARTASDIRVIEYDRQSGRYVRAYVRGDFGLSAPTCFAIRPASTDDANGNRMLDVCENIDCTGDVSGNHIVDINDLVAVIIHWGENGALAGPADINNDNIVNIDDLVLVVTNWGACP